MTTVARIWIWAPLLVLCGGCNLISRFAPPGEGSVSRDARSLDGGLADVSSRDGPVTPPDLAASLEAPPSPDLAPGDLTVAPDTTALPDTKVLADTAVLPDAAMLPDLTLPPDTTVSPDLTVLPDTTAAPDTTAPLPDGGGCVHPVVVQSCSNGWCTIPAGCFTMGSPASELCRSNNEDLHQVTLTHDFEMAETEVTQAQFLALMSSNPSYYDTCGTDCPVEQVTWHQAAAYCNALSAQKGLAPCYSCSGQDVSISCQLQSAYKGSLFYTCPGYRLPSDAEFEYAQRAGSTTSLYNTDLLYCNKPDPGADAIAWYSKNANKTQPIKGKLPNAWGLHDLAGNVSEWAQEAYIDHLGTAPQTDPLGGAGPDWVIRGGSFFDPGWASRSAVRYVASTDIYTNVGFRCVRTLTP